MDNPTFRRNPNNPQPTATCGQLRGRSELLVRQPLIHRISTANPPGYPQSYPHDAAHRVGPESHPGINHRTATPPQTPPTKKGPKHHHPPPHPVPSDTCHGPPATDTHDSQKTGTNSENKYCKQQTENAQASQPQDGARDTGPTGPRTPPTPAPDGTTPTAQHTPQTSTTSNAETQTTQPTSNPCAAPATPPRPQQKSAPYTHTRHTCEHDQHHNIHATFNKTKQNETKSKNKTKQAKRETKRANAKSEAKQKSAAKKRLAPLAVTPPPPHTKDRGR